MEKQDPARRRFFKTLAAGGATFALRPKTALADQVREPDPSPDQGFFEREEREALGSLADCFVPGARGWGAAAYIEKLLSAFEHTPPRIYAGGPFSGRQPYPNLQGLASEQFPANSFAEFLPLNRVQDRMWRLRLYGSAAIEGGAPNEALLGPVRGLREIFKKGLKEALSLSLGETGKGSMELVLPLLPTEFRDALRTLTAESAFAAPEYGGNRGGQGWARAHFEGDTLPLGYSGYDQSTQSYRERASLPVSTANPGRDSHRLGWVTRLILGVITVFLKGRIFR